MKEAIALLKDFYIPNILKRNQSSTLLVLALNKYKHSTAKRTLQLLRQPIQVRISRQSVSTKISSNEQQYFQAFIMGQNSIIEESIG